METIDDNDESMDEFNDFFASMLKQIRNDIVWELLYESGKTSITTEEYRQEWSRQWKRLEGFAMAYEAARSHLAHCHLVHEISPDVWAEAPPTEAEKEMRKRVFEKALKLIEEARMKKEMAV